MVALTLFIPPSVPLRDPVEARYCSHTPERGHVPRAGPGVAIYTQFNPGDAVEAVTSLEV
jgi:hypothetical protein